MSDRIRLSPELPELTLELFTSATGIVGLRGSGKTSDAVVIFEEAVRHHVPGVVIDPTGVWHGIKSSKDGLSPGLPVYVFGGVHGDVPLEPTAGALLARFIVEKPVPMVLDLSDFSKGQQRRFVTDFMVTLYDLKNRQRDPLLLILDEAARFVPQTMMRGDLELAKCIGAVEDAVTLGRSRGLGIVLIGQRSATINKNVLTQVDNLIAMRLTGPQDRKALDEWISEKAEGQQAERNELVQNLPSLKTGEGFFWSPSLFGVFRRVKFAARTTFDSSRTPKIGEKLVAPKVYAEVDLGALTAEIAATKERAKADDPKALRARIVELERDLSKRLVVEDDHQVCHEKLLAMEQRAENSEGIAQYADSRLRSIKAKLAALLDDAAFGEVDFEPLESREAGRPTAVIPRALKTSRPAEAPTSRARTSAGQPVFRAGAIRMLEACAQFEKRGLTRAQIAALAKIKQGPTFSTYFSELRAAGFISEQSGRVFATVEGIAFLPNVPPKPKAPEEIISRWRGEFRAGAVRMLDIVVAAYPQIATRAEIAEGSGILPGPTFSTYLSELKRAELIDERSGGLYAVVLDLVA